MMHDSRAVANEILNIAKAQGRPLTLMQLLKLVYLSHGWRLGLDSQPLTEDEVQAWQYGPVHPNVYKAFSSFGSKPIDKLAEYDFLEIPYQSNFEEREKWLLNEVVKSYGGLHAFRLSDMMHKPGTPWTETYNSRGAYSVIPNDVIKNYFAKLRTKQVDPASA